MEMIMTFDELFESESQSMAIKKTELSPENLEYLWLYDGKETGHMLISVNRSSNTASIVSYMKHGKFADRSGIGYDYIKMCIDSLLSDGLDIISVNRGRNHKSTVVWNKLANDYKVEDSVRDGDMCKRIRADLK
jgi:hypothetical protein